MLTFLAIPIQYKQTFHSKTMLVWTYLTHNPIRKHTHTLPSAVKQSSQHGASCMHARVYEVWHSVSLVHTAFCICHNPLSATLRQADNSREDRQPNRLHSELGRSVCKQHVIHTHTYIKHTCPAEMHVTHTFSRLSSELRCSSQGHISLRSSFSLSSNSCTHSLTLTISHLILDCRKLPQQMQACRCFFPPLCSHVSEKQSSTLSHEVSASLFLSQVL